jgi:uroporphyrinogen decarboxylase
MMETFEFDHLRQLIRRAKDAGCMVLMHVDGVVASLLPMFIEMGVDVLHPIDPSAGRQSIYEIKRLYGDKLALCGNIDVDGVLYKGTPEDVKRDVHEHITRLATGGGYIVGSSHDLHQLLPLENIYALRDAVHEYRFDGRAGKASHRGSPESSR